MSNQTTEQSISLSIQEIEQIKNTLSFNAYLMESLKLTSKDDAIRQSYKAWNLLNRKLNKHYYNTIKEIL
jgi:hypothetical protein